MDRRYRRARALRCRGLRRALRTGGYGRVGADDRRGADVDRKRSGRHAGRKCARLGEIYCRGQPCDREQPRLRRLQGCPRGLHRDDDRRGRGTACTCERAAQHEHDRPADRHGDDLHQDQAEAGRHAQGTAGDGDAGDPRGRDHALRDDGRLRRLHLGRGRGCLLRRRCHGVEGDRSYDCHHGGWRERCDQHQPEKRADRMRQADLQCKTAGRFRTDHQDVQ